MRPWPVTKPSPGTICSSMPKSRQRCVTSLSSSSKVPSSSSSSMRSRAPSLPSLCWRARRSGPPPCSAASCRRRSSSRRFIGTIVAQGSIAPLRSRLRKQFEAAVGAQVVFATAPQNRIPEKSSEPHGEAQHVLHGDEPEQASGEPIAQHVARREDARDCAQCERRRSKRPPRRLHDPEQQGEREWDGEELPDISGGTRSPCAAIPPESVTQIRAERLHADAVIDHIARENDAIAALRCELTHDEVFGKEVLHCVEAADLG